MVLREVCQDGLYVFSFSNNLTQVPPRRGFALRDAITNSQPHGGTYLGAAVRQANTLACDRLVIITDEQSHDTVPAPTAKKAYMINVASNQHGVGYGPWHHIDGFSEAVVQYLVMYEAQKEAH